VCFSLTGIQEEGVYAI